MPILSDFSEKSEKNVNFLQLLFRPYCATYAPHFGVKTLKIGVNERFLEKNVNFLKKM